MISGVSHRSRIASPALPLVWWARLAHSLTPVRPGPRRGRRLAILAAADATRLAPPAASAAVQRARASLTAAHDDDPNRPGRTLAADRRASALQACLPLLAKRAAEASDYLRALEADAPQVAVEGPSLVLQLTLAGALVAEGWLTYASLGATTLAESPVVLLASSIMAAPLAATLLSMAGASIRRMVWLGRPAWSECALVVLALVVAAVLGTGLTMSRVDGVSTGRLAALLTSAGLQALILSIALVSGYRHATPVPGIHRARRLRDRAARRHDQAVAELTRRAALAHDAEAKRAEVAVAEAAEFERVAARYGLEGSCPASAPLRVTPHAALAETPQWR